MNNQVVKQLILADQTLLKKSQHFEKVALFNTDGEAVGELAVVSTGSGVLLTGYIIGENAAVAATDTVNEAFGKLQKQINDLGTDLGTLSDTVDDHETRIAALEA